MSLKTILIIFLPIAFVATTAFCGFYVAKADLTLFNETSQVIIARKGLETTITMQSDFEGELEDFAMVVPVPVVLKKEQIKLVKPTIFTQLNDYSGPRLVEYHDENPCDPPLPIPTMMIATGAGPSVRSQSKSKPEREYKVKIEEQYTVGGYDILILSAQESGGLEAWLTDNGYKIPAGAAEVLEPYIRDDFKFFVVKINLEEFGKLEEKVLEPIQMRFESEKFGLPIRLGMANSRGDQDMIVYAFSDKGRVEVTNYRTVEVPTDKDIPTFVKDRYGEFYRDLFLRSWEKEGKDAVFLEYAWDLSSQNFVKCDPCPTTPPNYAQLAQAGVFWVENQPPSGWGGADYKGEVFMTRMHLRYGRQTFPQDLKFQVTPNRKNFQGRYVMHHPATGELDCAKGQQYIKELKERRQKELKELVALTGWSSAEFPGDYLDPYGEADRDLIPISPKDPKVPFSPWIWLLAAGLLLVPGSLIYRKLAL